MEFTNEEMVKSLTSLIDETLEEIEEIKKSKFAATEIKIGEDEGLAGKGKNGSLEAKKKEEDEEEEKEDEDKVEIEIEKAEEAKEEETAESEEEEKKEESKKKEIKEMKKSLEESESLMKSYVDSKMSSLEEKLSKMAAAIEALADAPVQRRSIPAGVAPLHKSAEEIAPLSKSEVANKLFELKKSGQNVDSSDIFRVETGNDNTVYEIATKYGLK